MKKALILVVLFSLCALAAEEKFSKRIVSALDRAAVAALTPETQPKKAKYVFYFIGDGMGVNVVQIAKDYLRVQDKNAKLNLEAFPVMGAALTYCADKFVTDSSASGTALASGYKTNYGVAGITPEMEAVDSVAVFAKKRGMKVGIVSTVTCLEATPGAFFAHQGWRGRYYPSIFDLVDSEFDYFAGGDIWDKHGKDVKLTNWQDATNILARGVVSCTVNAEGKPEIVWRNSEEIIQENGYKYVTTQEEFENLKPGCGKVYVSHPDRGWCFPLRVDKNEAPFLGDYVKKGIELLDNDKGFFMMVEGSMIDLGSHSNDGPYMLGEFFDFDNAIGVALDFYRQHPDETLIVVTADHETGALTLGHVGHHPEFAKYAKCTFGSFRHKVKEYKSKLAECRENHSNELSGNFDEILPLLEEWYGVSKKGDKVSFHKDEWEKLQKAFEDEINPEYDKKSDYAKYNYKGSENPFVYTFQKLFNNRCGIEYHTGGHSSAPSPIFAIGVDSAPLGGLIENTAIPVAIAKAIDKDGEFPTKPYKKPILQY